MIVVFDPTGRKNGKGKVGAARLSTLQGKRVAVIWNGKLGGDVFLNRVSEVLTGQFGVAGIERIDDRGDQASAGVDQVVVDRLAATCGAAVLGTGDWGGCSLWCIHSSLELEKRGIPTTTVCTTSFASLLKTTAKAKGLADMPLVVVAHPIAVNDDAAIRKKADDAMENLVRSLVAPGDKSADSRLGKNG